MFFGVLILLPIVHGQGDLNKTEIVRDVNCKLTGQNCGPNMHFTTIKQYYQFRPGFSMKLSLKKVCIQQCKYASTQEMKIVEKFTTQLTTRSPQCSKIGLCALNEKIEDPRCKLTDKKCGENMKFVTVNRSNRIRAAFVYSFRLCIQQCKCVPNEYFEKDGKCLRNSTEILNINQFAYSYGDEVFDFSCQLAGSKCGLNMMFVKIDPYKSRFAYPQFFSSAFCVVQCKCIKPYEGKDGRCI
ncbi:unnamed protein product [Dracunculus medinensis]|uniref:Apple domain-containing protein n=1 Tax=Dracunculus medinensis TaxID=318479 RepID=A0A158Q6G3_DRAME|nr:unnamed protein product [Dracunculus medinensis]